MFRFRTPQLLFKRLVKSHTAQTQKILTSFSSPNIPFSQTQFYSFSSFQQQTIHPSHQTEYQEEELALVNIFGPEKLPERRRVMKKYLQCKDLSLLSSNDITLISETLCCLALAHNIDGNPDKAYKYFKEDEDLNQRAGVRDTIGLAHSFYAQGSFYLERRNLIDAQHYLGEANRICLLLGEDKDAISLRLQCCSFLARIYDLQNDQDKALELYRSILEKTGDLPQGELPNVLISVSEGMGTIYSSRGDIEKTMEHWTKGLETAVQYFGENSKAAYKFSDLIADFLKNKRQYERALPYVKQSLEIALQIFPKDHPEVALNYSRLGYLEKDTEALNLYKKAIKILEKHPPQEVADHLSDCYFQSGQLLAMQKKPQEASKFLAKAAPSIALIFDGKDLAAIYSTWAEELRKIGNVMEDTKSYFFKAAKLYEGCKPPLENRELAEIYAALGIIMYNERDWEKACELMKKCESYFEAAQMNPEYKQSIYSYLTTALLRTGQVADGLKYAQKVLSCYTSK